MYVKGERDREGERKRKRKRDSVLERKGDSERKCEH